MKVTFIGTGTMGSIFRCNTSILVDDMLFDVGMGTVKQIERLKIYTKSIKYLVVSHFHADHFLDIPNFLIGRSIRNEIEEKLYIIGPKVIREKVKEILDITHSDGDIHKYENLEEKYNVEFIGLDNNESFETDEFTLTAKSLKHGDCPYENGYILQKQGKVISYACDTSICDNVYEICKSSNYVFLDVTGLETSEKHIGLNDYLRLQKEYPYCKIYGVHRGDHNIPSKEDEVDFPMDGEVIII